MTDFEIETELLKEYERTQCICQRDCYKICNRHKLIYCLICDDFFCPKCETETESIIFLS